MTREEQIREAAKKTTGLFSFRKGYSTAEDAFVAGAEWADNNQKSPWISVEDKLPDDGVLVIVAYRVRLGEILYASDVFYIDYGWENSCFDKVVAWMPIPELAERVNR